MNFIIMIMIKTIIIRKWSPPQFKAAIKLRIMETKIIRPGMNLAELAALLFVLHKMIVVK